VQYSHRGRRELRRRRDLRIVAPSAEFDLYKDAPTEPLLSNGEKECVREDALSAERKSPPPPQAVAAFEVESNRAAAMPGGEQLEAAKANPIRRYDAASLLLQGEAQTAGHAEVTEKAMSGRIAWLGAGCPVGKAE